MECVLVIGSNWGDRGTNIRNSLALIEKIAEVACFSSVYESPDCLGTGNLYLNQVVRIKCEGFGAIELEAELKKIERVCGREEESKKRGEVACDIDIVIVDGVVLREEDFKARYFQRGLSELKEI